MFIPDHIVSSQLLNCSSALPPGHDSFSLHSPQSFNLNNMGNRFADLSNSNFHVCTLSETSFSNGQIHFPHQDIHNAAPSAIPNLLPLVPAEEIQNQFTNQYSKSLFFKSHKFMLIS